MSELAAGSVRVRIDAEAGGRLASLEVDGLELLVGRQSSPLAWGAYPMAPWAGRVRRGRFSFRGRSHALPLGMPPHAIHGTTYTRAWRSPSPGRLEVELGPDWPFAGRAVQEIRLAPDRLVHRLEVHAESEPFPASAGWHPWWRRRLGRGGEAVLRFSARSMYRRDPEGLPDGVLVEAPPGPWDDCFTGVAQPVAIEWPGALRLEISATTDHWVVYDEPSHALCVEPLTGPPDALNLAPALVEPGRPLVLETTLRWLPG